MGQFWWPASASLPSCADLSLLPLSMGVSGWQEVAAGTTLGKGTLQLLWALRGMGTSLPEDPAIMLIVKD